MTLLDRQVLLVTGKGGVGKSSVTAALSWLGASLGKRTLALEIDQKGNLTDFFEHEPVGYHITEVARDLYALTLNYEDTLEEYLRVMLKLPLLTRIGPVARIFDFVATAAPGIREILVTGKTAFEARERKERGDGPKWDLIVVDCQATGHIVAQLEAHRTMAELVQVGMVRQQTRWMAEILEDPQRTGVVIVATPEEMPVSETIELYGLLRERTRVDVAAVIANRVLPEILGRGEEEVFEALTQPEAAAVIAAELGTDPSPIFDAARLAVTLRRTRAGHLRRLREELPIPIVLVPYFFVKGHGMRTTRLVADYLAQELS